MINNLPVTENRPIEVFENRPYEQLVHSHGRGKHIRDKELEEIALKKYHMDGRGITFSDVVEEYRCSKDKAQRRLKNGCKEKIDKNGKKRSILFTLDNGRTKPQQYFPSCIKARIIENKRKRQNGLIGTTGTNYNSMALSPNPLNNAFEHEQVSNFVFQLKLLHFQPLNIHKIHLQTIIDKIHYDEINQVISTGNHGKVQNVMIGFRNVVFTFHKNGSIEIAISCSKNPFPIETDNDVNNFFIFLGQVKDRLANILNDPRERIVPQIDKWILKYCDFNKDVEIEDKDFGQLMDLNIQIKYAGEAFRLYVKNLENRFALRGEKVIKVNQPLTTFMNDSILNPSHLIQTTINEFANNIVERIITDMNHRIDKLEKLINADK